MFVPGFYYKTHVAEELVEKVYEPIIRRAAGLRSASTRADPDKYEKSYAHCEVLVIGSGPTASWPLWQRHVRGNALFSRTRVRGSAVACCSSARKLAEPTNWASGVIAELASMPNVRLMPRTTIFGWYDGNVFGGLERVNDHVAAPSPFEPRQRYWRIITKRAVLAAGAEERPITFGGNDIPGVMLASAMRAYANRYATVAGGSAVVFTNNNSAYRTARNLKALGVHVEAIVDSRKTVTADTSGLPVILEGAVADVKGGKSVYGVRLTNGRTIECDTVAMSGGWSPSSICVSSRRQAALRTTKSRHLYPQVRTKHSSCCRVGRRQNVAIRMPRRRGAAGAFDGKAISIPKCRDEALPSRRFGGSRSQDGRPLSIFRTTLRQAICCLPLARATPTLSSPNDTPPPAWRPTRASLAMSTPSRSLPRPPVNPSNKSGPLRFGPIIRRSRLARLPAHSPAITFNRCAKLPYMIGPPSMARCLSKPACGCVPRGFPKTATTGVPVPIVKCATRGTVSAFVMFQRSARSISRAKTPAPSLTNSISTHSRRSPWAKPVTA